MNDFPNQAKGFGKFKISASPVKSESQRNTFSDLNSSSVKSETGRNTFSDPNSISLPSRLCECECKVVLVQDLLECGVVQLEGANRKAYCLFFRKDFLGRNEVDQKLSAQVPVGTKLRANARLIRERNVIPFLATSVWEDGAIRGENELSKLFSCLESQEIEQYNTLSRDLGWFLPREDCFNNDVDEGVTRDVNESNNNSTRYYHGQSKNRSPRYRHSQKRSRSPGHNSRIKSRSRSSRHNSRIKSRSRSPGHNSRIKSRSRSPRHNSRIKSRSRSPRHNSRIKSRSRSPRHNSRIKSRSRSPRHNSRIKSRSRSPRHNSRIKSRSRSPTYRIQASRRSRSRSPRGRPGRSKSKSPSQEKARRESSVINAQRKREFLDEKRIKNQIKNTEGAESFQLSRTRSRSPRYTERKNPRYGDCQEQNTQESSSVKYKRKQDFREISDEKKLNNEIEDIGRIETEAVEINYQQELKKCENQVEESLKLKRENKESAFGCSSNTKEIGESISVRHDCSIGSNLVEEGRNEDETIRGENAKATKDIAVKVLNKTAEDVSKPTIRTSQLVIDWRPIVNGKGKILKIIDSNYGIAIVLGFEGLFNVLFDTYDVLIEGQVCADLGKTLHEVMQEGDLVCLHAIPIGDSQIEYMATAVARASNIEALLNTTLPADIILPSLKEVSQDKIKNFHQVAKVVLEMQYEEVMVKSMEKDEIPVDNGILWKQKKNVKHVNFFCFHCKKLHSRYINASKSWEEHNKHVLTCQGLKCLEGGNESFQRRKQELKPKQMTKKQELKPKQTMKKQDFKPKQTTKKKGGFNAPHNMATENEEVLQAILRSAVNRLITRREMLHLPKHEMSSSYHRYFCIHCKVPFSDKRHIQGVKHSRHMAQNSCNPTCKFVLLEDGKYVSHPGKSAKWCFVCNVKLLPSNYQAHIKGSPHSLNILNLLKKKEHND